MDKDTPPETPTNVVPIKTGQFQKGSSGNPSGKASPTSRRSVAKNATAIYKRRSTKVAAILWEMIEDKATPATVRFNAVNLWLDRAHGKPKQSIEVESTTITSDLDTSSMSDATLREILAASKASKGSK
jgi:hypothetical protein